METVVDFIGRISEAIKNSMSETNTCIGKEVVDTTAGKKGICIDRITNFYGTKVSFLGVKYTKEEEEKINKFDTDVLVCQTAAGKMFIPITDVNAIGESIILLKNELKVPEINPNAIRKTDVFKRYQLTIDAIKDVFPSGIPQEKEKGWLKKLVGE
ncbi:MAG: hypothetical protein QXY45_01570 [Candidatus Aenigmatarchaeota archaeon]